MQIARFIAVTTVLACGAPTQPTEWTDEGDHRWRELAIPRRGRAGFARMSPTKTGVDFQNVANSEEAILNQNLVLGSGVALGDVDGDGLVDIYLARTEGPNVLYKNLGGFRFADITADAGVAAPDRYSTGAVLADIDGDADLDLFVTALGGPNALFINDGTGHFTERTSEAGLESDRGSTTSTFADVDGDGDLDLYVSNYKLVNATDLFADEELLFDNAVTQVGEDEWEMVPKLRDHYRFERVDGEWVRTELADVDWFYLNDGAGRFDMVPFTSGRFRDEHGKPLMRPPRLFGLAARFYDVDNDGDPDLYVCNDFEHPDLFWLNDGAGNFQAAPRAALRTTSNASMGIDFADINHDGHVDFYVVDMMSRDRRGRHMRDLAHRPPPKKLGDLDQRPQWQRNTLFLGRGDATFAQIAEFAGVTASDWSWTPVFLDVDLDGFEDILVTTGYSWDVYQIDSTAMLRATFPNLGWRERRLLFPSLEQRNVAFRNRGDLTFEHMGAEWGFGDVEDISHGIATADLDGDGDLDVVLNRLGAPATILRNDVTANRIAVRLIGRAPNTAAIGSKIRVLGGAVPEQSREVTSGGRYLSSSETLLTFGTGNAERVDIEVEWRHGQRSIIRGAGVNRLYEISAPDASTFTSTTIPTSPSTAPLFTDVSALLDHEHTETTFDDYQRQPLVPHQLSLLGPGVTWYDVDQDGDDDLLITSGRGGRLAYYRNDGGRFTLRPAGPSVALLDQTMVIGMPNRIGSTDLILGQSNYEAPTAEAALAAPAVLRIIPGRAEAGTMVVPGEQGSTGPLAVADYDGDGDLDLFVGARVIPGAYPVAANARFFRQEEGRFVLDESNQQVTQAIGLVSSAVFSDIDGDGDVDLLLALDWGPITVLRNDGGRFADATTALGLGSFTSRWNGIATGDLDGDGRPDIVATSWGRNTRYHTDGQGAPAIVFGEFGGSGSVDVLEVVFDREMGGFAPLTERSRVVAAIAGIQRVAPTQAVYAGLKVEELLGGAMERAGLREASSLDHMVFMNRGNKFEATPLPDEAQFAPAFYVGVTDFNGDGNEDVFLTQNFFPTDPMSPPFDAGRGLLLMGDGRGGLAAVPGHVSGITVYGDQRGAAFTDYDGDGRTDLVVSQNAAATKLYRNVGATPGIRVRLAGRAGNPHAIGAKVRMLYEDRRGPAREIQAGSGYWSSNGVVQVFSRANTPVAVWVRWPDGSENETPLATGQRELTVRSPN